VTQHLTMVARVLVTLALAGCVGTAYGFAAGGLAARMTPSLRCTARTSPLAGLRMNNQNGMEEISAEEYAALLEAAGRQQEAPPAAEAPKPAGGFNPFGGLFGGGQQAAPAPAPPQQQQQGLYEDDSVNDPLPVTGGNPFGGFFGGGQQKAQEEAAAAAAAAQAAEAAAAAQAAAEAEAAAAAAAAAAQQQQQGAPFGGFNPFGGLFGGGGQQQAPPQQQQQQPAATSAAPEEAMRPKTADGEYADVSEAELKELMEKAGKTEVAGFSLFGGQQAAPAEEVAPYVPPTPAGQPPPVAGVKVTTIRKGDRKTYPQVGDTLTMHYVGKLRSTKQVFDSSVERGQPFTFQIGVGSVIPGWDFGVPQMSLGEKAQLVIDANMAYGPEGRGNIPPNSDLVFDVDLLAVNGVAARLRE